MAIYDYLPTYHQIEVNSLKGLQPGFVVSQMNVADDSILVGGKMLENGKICGISANGIVAATAETKVLFIAYAEPLNTIVDGAKFFAVNTTEECPRLVQLIPGDEWMSDMDPADVCIEGRIVEITADSDLYDSDDFYKVSTLADGTAAHHYLYLG